ncbi:NAD(P)/FAD-dependent oxidoreductase [Amnibacterium flavum]|uniref:NAD(P)/FAD-dependent oxidoreductase n=1 Tax=Amnibacterium flavum TaxID=2173173 RepID=A0A2V1HP25_9MICO|nr:NAD(P)/FAD-dependent oxidoreductase [Amnibacterium flavum]PVZ94275.1 NAD(P)/FAD-dependent oxidoreductase [Amnibacterium flavum]
MTQKNWDVIIVGGGSAGLSAALMLVRARRQVLVLDGGEPRNRTAPHMHAVLSRDDYSPLDLLADGRREVEGYGGTILEDGVTGAEIVRDGFAVTTGSGARHTARRLLVATGLRDALPEVDGLAEQWGTGVVTCPYCDGWEVRDRRIAVLGSGGHGVLKAQMLRQWSADVVYLTNGSTPPTAEERAGLDARGIRVEERRIRRIVARGGDLSGIETEEGETIPVDSIFVNPSSVPQDDLLVGLGATRSALMGVPFVAVDPTGLTSVPGVWAAGNVVNPAAGVPVAMGAGSSAGAAINMDLIGEDIRAAAAHPVRV